MSPLFRLSAVCLVAAILSGAAGADDKTSLAQQAQAILKANCYKCHGEQGASEGGFNYILDRQRLVAAKKIVPGDSAQSRLFKKLKKNEMPPEDEKQRPTQAEVTVIRQWIEAGATDFNAAPPPRQIITQTAIVDGIRADLEKAGERDRP